MAQHLSTKLVMANAFKRLLEEKTLSKITVEDICAGCGMTRQSFYYHFVDKYDLVNWIFDSEYVSKIEGSGKNKDCGSISGFCNYLYDKKEYYSKIIEYEKQNSFFEYCKELIMPVMRRYIEEYSESEETLDFETEIISDAILNAIKRWIVKPQPMTPEMFIKRLKTCGRTIEKYADDWC